MHKHPELMAAVLLIAGLPCGSALAQNAYPSKPLRLIVPFAPGGGTDIVARLLAQKLTESFKQTVIVDNRAGGGGTMGAETTVRATPDGYTTIIMSGSYATNAAMYKLPYDPVNDVVPMGLIGDTAFIIALHPGVPIKNVGELVAFANVIEQALRDLLDLRPHRLHRPGAEHLAREPAQPGVLGRILENHPPRQVARDLGDA